MKYYSRVITKEPIAEQVVVDAIKKVCVYYGVSMAALKGKRREHILVNGRRVLFLHFTKDLKMSTTQAAGVLNRNHSTLLYHNKTMVHYGRLLLCNEDYGKIFGGEVKK